ncbi:MAG: hypothetical protein ACI9LY_003937, partial [Arenicella sp.]
CLVSQTRPANWYCGALDKLVLSEKVALAVKSQGFHFSCAAQSSLHGST